LKVDRTRFSELADDFIADYKVNRRKSIVQAEIRVRHLSEFLEDMKANQIDTATVNRYIQKRQEEGAENATINRELTSLKRMFSLAVKCTPPKVRQVPHIMKLKENNVRTGFFEQSDYLRMKDALPDYLRPIFVTAYFTGLRKGELRSLTWDKVNLFERKISLFAGTTKNDAARTIFLAGELYDTLQTHYTKTSEEHPNCAYVFHKNGNQLADFRKAWDRALREAGYKSTFKCRDCGEKTQFELNLRWKKEGAKVFVSEGKVKKGQQRRWEQIMCPRCKGDRFQRDGRVFHDNRRTAVRNLARTGTPEGVAMKISGHKTRTIFERYNIVSEDDLRMASERLSLAHDEGTKRAQIDQLGHNHAGEVNAFNKPRSTSYQYCKGF
jgi:integrase